MTGHAPTVTAHALDKSEAYALVVIGDRSSRRSLAGRDGGRAVTIGRGEDNDLHIDDTSVSRRHARLELDAGGGTVEDLGSHNGTRLNGVPLAGRQRVASGDVVSVGVATLVLYLARRPTVHGRASGDLGARLDAEVDRALRYDGVLAVVLWDAGPEGAGLGRLIDPVLRPCDAAGVGRDDLLLGIFPGLEGAAGVEVARRGLDLLRVAAPGARAGVASFPADAADAPTLLLAARDALVSAGNDVG